jgi:hypothetical protein
MKLINKDLKEVSVFVFDDVITLDAVLSALMKLPDAIVGITESAREVYWLNHLDAFNPKDNFNHKDVIGVLEFSNQGIPIICSKDIKYERVSTQQIKDTIDKYYGYSGY